MDSNTSDFSTKAEENVTVENLPVETDRNLLYRGLKKAKKERGCTAKERISKMPPCTAGKRSSIYRGVTRHRWTGRYEAHLWDKSTWNQNQNKKGKQVYLGAYDDEEAAARAYDLAALKYWGPGTLINFPVTDYTRDLEEMQNLSREDYLASLRRKSSGFSRGIAKYRSISSNHWDSQFGRGSGADYSKRSRYGAGDETTGGVEFAGGFCTERKIDLSTYIKWWGPHKSRQADSQSKSFDEASFSDDVASELKTLERSVQPTEPYEMPHLGMSPESAKRKTISAMSVLAKSAAYKSLQEKTSKNKEKEEDDENETKNGIGLGMAVQKLAHEGGSGKHGVAFDVSEVLTLQRNVYPLSSLLTAPLVTNYSSMDPLTDPIMWSSLVPVLAEGSSRPNEVTKNESGSDYAYFQHGE